MMAKLLGRVFFAALFVAVGLFSSTSSARGGFLVGSGAGLAEQNVRNARAMLPSLISSCIALRNVCEATEDDVAVLREIANIVRTYPGNHERIVFLSEKDSGERFFYHQAEPWPRLAKSGTAPGSPSVWNLDQLYGKHQQPAVDLGTLVATWAHEIGHQAGQNGPESHAYLDELGSKLRRMFENRLVSKVELPFNSGASMVAVNYRSILGTGELFLSVGMASVSLSPLVNLIAACPAEGDLVRGWEIVNPRLVDPSPETFPRDSASPPVRFAFFLRLRCQRDDLLIDPPHQYMELKVDFTHDSAGQVRPIRAWIPARPDFAQPYDAPYFVRQGRVEILVFPQSVE